MKFYDGKYDYDKHITTPPGLYFIGVVYLKILDSLLEVFTINFDRFNHLYLRYFNSTILGSINFILLYKIFEEKTE